MSKKPTQAYSGGSLTMRLIVGIFSILLSFIVGFQSCAASLGDALGDSKTDGGFAGTLLGFFFLAGGIITVAARKTKGGIVTSTVMYILGGIIALTSNAGFYKDLKVWAVVSLIFAVLLIISLFMKIKDAPQDDERK